MGEVPPAPILWTPWWFLCFRDCFRGCFRGCFGDRTPVLVTAVTWGVAELTAASTGE